MNPYEKIENLYELPDDNYGIFILSPDDSEVLDEEDFGYDWVRENAIDSHRAETKEELLLWLINGLNYDTISDMNWFFLVDLEKEIILSQIPYNFR